ncbi:MAG TPA: GNAT family N-acetyltransferase, partial [Mycobacteriales bacterium]|nr:GNAT family N-acetyltransferase [Mycobacteriales bacterium]
VRHVTRPGMALSVAGLRRPDPPADLEIRVVRSRADWSGYVDVQVDAFDLDPAIAAGFPPYSVVGGSRMQLLVGAVDGVVTCAAAIFRTGADAGVFAVGTLASHRGRGHGSAITAAAVDVAGAMGAGTVALQSSADGLGVYRALGFAEIGSWVVWMDPAVERARAGA